MEGVNNVRLRDHNNRTGNINRGGDTVQPAHGERRMKNAHIQTYFFERPESLVNGKWTHKAEEWEVEVMAIVGKYAMVRRKACFPFVVSVKELRRCVKPS